MSKKCTLITGGVRSGKSRYALLQAQQVIGQKVFIATAQAFDEGMSLRIKKHQEERGTTFTTIEEPVFLAQAIKQGISTGPQMLVIDCLTFWVNNLFYHLKNDPAQIRHEFDLFLSLLVNPSVPMMMVTNEVGLGIMPDNRLARIFMDELGILNQKVAQSCDEVVLMTASIPQFIKKGISYE